jgi:Putative Actinobacterial Holin-X, holin superfamily III
VSDPGVEHCDGWVGGWVAAVIVPAIYGAIAGVLALTGKSKVQEGVPPVPEQAAGSAKEAVEWTKQRAKEGRQWPPTSQLPPHQ